jgi:PAS domain-containing protein
VVTLVHGRSVRGFVMGIHKPDASLTWILVNSEPLLGGDGQVRGAVISFADITERKRAAEQLARSERMVRTVTDGLPGMVAYWTADLHLAFANRSYSDWFGRLAEEIIGVHLNELLEPVRRGSELPFVRGALRGESKSSRARTKDPTAPSFITGRTMYPTWPRRAVRSGDSSC